jgi:molybdopterin biosynthesis enzyme
MLTVDEARARILSAVRRLPSKHTPILDARGLVLADGTDPLPLTARTLGALAARGQHTALVFRRPRAAIISIGDHLAAPGDPLQPGEAFDGNRVMLHLQALDAGAVVDASLYAPERAAMVKPALDGLRRFDLIVANGGGADLLREAGVEDLETLNVDLDGSVPISVGRHGDVPLINLPADPDLAFTAFEALVAPALAKMMGCPGG